jgi:hypothetical protein
MWSNFVHLFWRTIHGMPVLVSSNWASWGLGFAIFVLYETLTIWMRGLQDMILRWKQNVGLGLLATGGGYLILFTFSAVATIYDEHHDSTGRWQAVVKEKDALKVGLKQRDDYIKTLEARTCPSPHAPKTSSSPHLDVPQMCRTLSKCPSGELKQRTLDLANKIDNIYQVYMRQSEAVTNEAHHDRRYPDGPDELGKPISQKYDLRYKYIGEDAVAEYDKCCQADAKRYREELLNRVPPGLHNVNIDDEYARPISYHFVTFLRDIVSDLRNLAANIEP